MAALRGANSSLGGPGGVERVCVSQDGKVTEASIGTSKLERELLAERERAASLARENERLQARLESERREAKELEARLQSISGGLAASAILAAPRTFERASQPVASVSSSRPAESGERSASPAPTWR